MSILDEIIHQAAISGTAAYAGSVLFSHIVRELTANDMQGDIDPQAYCNAIEAAIWSFNDTGLTDSGPIDDSGWCA